MAAFIHNVLEAACKGGGVAPTEYEAAAGKPELYNRTYVELIVWIVERIRPELAGKDCEKLDEMVEEARAYCAGSPFDKDRKIAIRRIAYRDPPPEDTDVVGQLTQSVAHETMEAVINNVCGKGSRVAAKHGAKILGGGGSGSRAFLDALNAEILRLDAVTTIERQALPAKSAVTSVLWRGAMGAKVTHVVVKLAAGNYGLIAKTKGKWTWAEGERDEILATLPDAQMEGAVAAVVGEKGSAASSSGANQHQQAKRPVGGAVGGQIFAPGGDVSGVGLAGGCVWFVAKDGRVTTWTKSQWRIGNARAGKVTGIYAASAELAVTWGALLTLWRRGAGVQASAVDTDNLDVEDALIVPNSETVVWLHKSQIVFGDAKKKKIETELPNARLILDRERENVVVWSPLGMRRYTYAGKPDGKKIDDRFASLGSAVDVADHRRLVALWEGKKAKTLTIKNLDTAETLTELTLDAAEIDQVTFAADARILVRYHAKKRIAVFTNDAGHAAKRTHRIQARGLGSKGSSVDELFALKRGGAILAFAPYPRGETLLINYDAQILDQWKLNRFYTGGHSFFVEDNTESVFAYTRDGTRALRF